MLLLIPAAGLACLIALSAYDLREGRLPNWLVATLAALGAAHHFLSASFSAIATHSLGSVGRELKKGGRLGFAQHASRGAVAAIVGGTASTIGGGKFANGAATGTFVYAFNHVEGRYNRRTGKLALYDLDDSKKSAGITELFFTGSVSLEDLNRGVFSATDGIPAGKYDILERGGRDGFFRLEPRDGVYGDDRHEATGRDLFRLHEQGTSVGCVTACRETNWNKVEAFIKSTTTNSVFVYRYGGVRAWLHNQAGRLGYNDLIGRTPRDVEPIKRYGTLTVE